MGIADKNVGAQFDILDKAVAGRLRELIDRPQIAIEDYNAWLTDYSQLKRFAEQHGDNKYVAKQWIMEQPMYAGWPERLRSKVVDTSTDYTSIGGGRRVIADPRNYDTTISIFGQGVNASKFPCGPCCGDSGLTIPDRTPQNTSPISPRGGGGITVIGTSSPYTESLGDLFRNLLGPRDIPSISAPYPDSPLINQNEIVTGVITAIVVGVIVYVIHQSVKRG